MYRQSSDETLRKYVQRFSKKRNELPNITDADVINAFTYGTTYEDSSTRFATRPRA
jgi:hypothetical protein